MLTDYYFWFAQPSTILNNYDWLTAYVFAGLFLLSLILMLVKRFFTRHPVTKKLMGKWATAFFWVGIVGIIWFGFRYQAIPLLSKRVFAASILGLGVIWIGFVKWYMLRKFFKEKREYDYVQVKNKYIK